MDDVRVWRIIYIVLCYSLRVVSKTLPHILPKFSTLRVFYNPLRFKEIWRKEIVSRIIFASKCEIIFGIGN